MIRRVVVMLAVSGLVLGCGLLKKKDATDPDPADAATVAAGGTGAANEADVLRYAQEVPLANAPAVIGKAGATPRTFPGTGTPVATLPAGTPCAKVAQYFSTGTLILFSNPANDGTSLLGWVTVASFDTGPLPPTVKPYVPPAVTAKVDAGAKVVDAGVAVSTVAVVADAGAKPADAGTAVVACMPSCPAVAGKCPPFRSLDGTTCRVPCKGDADCPKGTGSTLKCSTKKVCI